MKKIKLKLSNSKEKVYHNQKKYKYENKDI